LAFKLKLKTNSALKIEILCLAIQNVGAIAILDANKSEIFSTNEEPAPIIKTDIVTVYCDSENLDTCLGIINSCAQLLSNEQIDDNYTPKYEPVIINDNFAITPSEIKNLSFKKQLKLSPGLAFGSGHHETTNMCLQWISENNLDGKSILDLGCGSGILGLSAKLLWDCDVLAIDNDNQAIDATLQNASNNNLSIKVDEKLDTNLKFELVIANIYFNVLKNFIPTFNKILNENSTLLLTGVDSIQANSLVEDLRELNFQIQTQMMNDWVLIVATKSNNTNFVLNG